MMSGAWLPPQDEGHLGSLDMRSAVECDVAGGTGGWGIFAYDREIVGVDTFTIATDPQEAIGPVRRTILENRLGVTLTAPRFAGIMAELYLQHIDVTGATKRKPILPTNRKRLEIILGGKIFDVETGPGDGARWLAVRAQYRHDFRQTRLSLPDGHILPRKILGYWLRRYGLSDATEFQTPGDPVIEPIEPATTINDTFDRADADELGTLSDGSGSWVDTANDYGLVSNAAVLQVVGATNTTVADVALSSADHYAQATMTVATDGGASVRCNTANRACYLGSIRDANNDVRGFLLSSGDAYTQVGSTASVAVAAGDTVKTEINGSTLKVYHNTVERVSGTNSTLSTPVRCGLWGFNGGTFDNFEAADLGAGAPATPPSNRLSSNRLSSARFGTRIAA